MKKLLLFLTVTLMGSLGARAQSSLIGTLSHDGEVTVYYGADALIKAHEAAVPGDVITLSAGTFTATDITKAVTIRGAGMMLEQTPTIISGRLYFKLTQNDDDTNSLNLEGLRILSYYIYNGSMKSPSFLRCYFDDGQISTNYDNATFVNCYVKNFCGSQDGFRSTTLNNCVVEIYNNDNDKHTVAMNNCVVLGFQQYSYPFGFTTVYSKSTTWTNCIVRGFHTSEHANFAFDNGNVFINCRYQGTGTNPFNRVASSCVNTKKVADDIVIFKNDTFYELSDDLVNNEDWTGNDDTQIGIYGGVMPFDPTPTNPQITKFKVANKTSADGKLSVDIEVSAAQ